MSKKTNIVVVDSNKDIVTLNNINVVPYLFSSDRITKVNCKICQSKLRDKVEEIYENQTRKNYAEIKRKLKNEDDFDISIPAVKNHLIFHYKMTQDNVSLQEYTEDVQKWVNMQTNKVASLKSRIAILTKEMMTIDHLSVDLDIIERRKSAETVKKLAETILTHEDKLNDFYEETKPVNLIFNQLQVIVKDELQYIESPKTKKVLSNVLSRLKDSVGDMIVE